MYGLTSMLETRLLDSIHQDFNSRNSLFRLNNQLPFGLHLMIQAASFGSRNLKVTSSEFWNRTQISSSEGVNSSFSGMPIVSGSLNQDGDISSNLTFSGVTSTTGVFSLSISAGQFLNTGNFTLTICPRLAANDTTTNPPPVRQCGVLFLEVRNSPMSNFDNYVMYVSLATVAVAASAVVSLLYMKRWRSA